MLPPPTTYDYEAFGQHVHTSTAETVRQAFAFTGRRRDSPVAHLHLRNRQYGPEAGRLLARDPLHPPASGAPLLSNAYGYVAGNPTTRSDPSGLKGETIWACSLEARGPESTSSVVGWYATKHIATPPIVGIPDKMICIEAWYEDYFFMCQCCNPIRDEFEAGGPVRGTRLRFTRVDAMSFNMTLRTPTLSDLASLIPGVNSSALLGSGQALLPDWPGSVGIPMTDDARRLGILYCDMALEREGGREDKGSLITLDAKTQVPACCRHRFNNKHTTAVRAGGETCTQRLAETAETAR
jgi:RHS repeat-associated protein